MDIDWKISIQTIIQALGLVSIILLFIQLRMNNRWNKIREALNIAVKDNLSVRNKELNTELERLRIDPRKLSITDEDVSCILGDEACRTAVVNFLAELELISAASNRGVVNDFFTYCMYSGKILLYDRYFLLFIEKYRILHDDPEYYIELQKIAKKWNKQFARSKKALEKKRKG